MHDIALRPKNPDRAGIRDSIPLELSGTVKTYRYLDEEEAAAQEKAVAGNGGNG
jgi:type IV pilus assembly protein PilO